MQPEHLEAFGVELVEHPLRPMVRMGMSLENFRPKDIDEALEIKQLSMGDIGEIIDLFGFYPDNFFEPAQLSTGYYYGVRIREKLVSVAGVHVFSPQVRVACLGNIVTHPEYRGRGLSTRCTSHLCSQLAKAGIDLFALNVERSNSSAVRVYKKLGFEEHATYLEGEVSTLFRARR
jgi:GNAT superfamily N-acetyltransferase